jgi:predicted dinucleotide-binding enzyme
VKIGIIGAGNIGGALTRRLTALGHDVSVANSRGPETLADLAAETGAKPVLFTEAARGAEVVIVTIPQAKVASLPKGLLDEAAEGVAVIDTGNYYPRERDGRIDEIENGVTESRWVSDQLGHPVVKVFNGIYAQHLQDKGVPKGTEGRIALPVAGDDAAAKAKVLQLVEDLGFDAYDAGGIDESWKQQPATPSYGADASLETLPTLLAQASPTRTPEFTA